MNIGKLRERVTIEVPTFTDDAIGGKVEGPPTTIAANLPAAVESLGIWQQRLQVGQLRGVANKRVVLRTRSDITDAMRVLWDGAVLEIGLVDYMGDELHLYCAEAPAGNP